MQNYAYSEPLKNAAAFGNEHLKLNIKETSPLEWQSGKS